MNFTPFPGFATGSLQPGAVHQFATAKFAQNLTTGGQVVGVLSGGEGGVHYLRPVDPNGFAVAQGGNNQQQQIITLPITVPGKDGTQQQQTVQIQVVNPSVSQSGNSGDQPKYHIAPISLGQFPQGAATVLTVAYSQQQGTDGLQIQVQPQNTVATTQTSDQTTQSTSVAVTTTSQQTIQQTVQLPGAPEGLTVVAQIPQDLILREGMEESKEDVKEGTTPVALIKRGTVKNQGNQSNEEFITAMPAGWQSLATPGSTVADYLSRLPASTLPLGLQHFLKFSAETIKREATIESSPLGADGLDASGSMPSGEQAVQITVAGGETILPDVVEEQEPGAKPKRKKKYKKKPPKPKKPKPGQVSIVTALDGTTLFCCPQCNMAYPEKELLEQHLIGHKIERRFICDICGAGLKRKEHLERHKLGHNPDRPFICSVCMKGFKRKEHLNLHFVIHSGQKTEVCSECGKAFYRKDHLRKHARSHLAKRAKEDPLNTADTSQNQQQVEQAQQQTEQQMQQQSSEVEVVLVEEEEEEDEEVEVKEEEVEEEDEEEGQEREKIVKRLVQ
ncbi:hypothetical protein M0804_010008 [Polistes exclamans]|nr:hypothetical protein M0804_010008 [Polistes exclamans]